MISKQLSKWAVAGMVLAVGSIGRSLAAAASLELHPGDHICTIGNTMADRMQHHAWLETYLHALHPQHELTCRNLGFAGDEVKRRPRSENFGNPDQWLTKCNADVVFCFFGYNEALRGPADLATFESDLGEMIDHMRSQTFNGSTAPRLVVFSPIATEDLHSSNLPDGTENNRKLAVYTEAMQKVCRSKKVLFVDLFSATQELYAASDAPLTLNGIHLLDRGNQAVAKVIVDRLFPSASPSRLADVARLRQAVLDKNLYWFSRYRVVDGYNVYGGRSKLAWFGQSNADVMRREMEIFDIKTANRDRRVWAVAQGSELLIKDDNLPELRQVQTNKPGPLEGARFPYLDAEEAIGKMKVADGMQVNVFASEAMFPRLINPVQMAVDTNSRLWASVWPSYPHWNPTEPREDALVILPDENGDGVADGCIVFADQLNSITSFEFWGGGVLVAAPPEIWFLKDTDGDDRADVKLRVLQGLSSADTHHSANAMLIGPDGWLYWSRGIFNVANVETPTTTYRSGKSGVHRFNPRTFEVEFHFPIGPNPHGDVFDRWGYQFANDGTGGTGCYVNIGKGIGNKQWFKKRVRPVAAIGILSSSHFPDRNNGNFLICNTIGFLGVLQHEVRYEGADITAHEIEPIVVSSDPNFRPSDLEVGGDGALYISDWHNALIGHMQHNMRDPNRDHAHGRIYRVTCKGRPLLEPAKMKGKPIAEVLQRFLARENGTRYRARLELSGRDTQQVIAGVSAFAANLDPHSVSTGRDEAQALLECVWVCEEHRVANMPLIRKAFQAEEPRVRAAVIRSLGHWAGKVDGWDQTLLSAARDRSAIVRAEAVKAAVEFAGTVPNEVFFEVAMRPSDGELRTVLAYAHGRLPVDTIVRNALQTGKDLSPAAFEYALHSARVADLLKGEPSETVYRAILARKEATVEQLAKALDGLAKVTKTDRSKLLMERIDEVGSKADGNLARLGELLAGLPVPALQSVRDRIEQFAVDGKSVAVRRWGYVAWIAAAGPGDAYLAASQSKNRLRDFLEAVSKVPAAARGRLYEKVRPLISELPVNPLPVDGDQTLHEAAIRALASIPGHDAEIVAALAALVRSGRYRPAAIAALRRMPLEAWPEKELRPLADNLIGYLSELPASYRTGTAATDATALVRSLASRLSTEVAEAIEERLHNLDVRVIAIGTVPHRMIFDKERIAVQAGKPVEFRFANNDAMPHNFSITVPGALAEIGELGEATARDPDAMSRNYVPKSAKILLASRLLQPGEQQKLSFEAPSQPGVYPYVCTYPGHWRRMYGALYVVADLEKYQADPEAYLAANPLPIEDALLKSDRRNHEWTFDELFADVKELPPGRSFEVGKQLFTVATCVACHQLDNEGHVFGPDLAKLDAQKHTTEHILRSMVEPSQVIDAKYLSYAFVLDSGKVTTGMIVEETASAIKVVIDPLAKNTPTVIRKDEIDEQKKSSVSLMPAGLLNRLTREEILDLIAFVYSGGDGKSTLFAEHDY